MDTYAGGYYRILYDDRNYRLISEAMIEDPDQFHVMSKASLLENAREFFNNQQLTMTTVMDVFIILENEDNYIAWSPVQSFILEVDLLFLAHQNYAKKKTIHLTFGIIQIYSSSDKKLMNQR